MTEPSRNTLSNLHEELLDALPTNDALHDARPEDAADISQQAERLDALVAELGQEAQALLDSPKDRGTDEASRKAKP